MAVARSGWVTLVAVLYLISGVINLLVGLVALGVTLSGSANVETVYVGDWPTDDLVGAAIVVIVFAAVQIVLGAGVLRAVGKPFAKTRGMLAEGHLRAAVHHALATDRLCAMDEMAVLGTRPYKRSSGLSQVFPGSLRRTRQCAAPRSIRRSLGLDDDQGSAGVRSAPAAVLPLCGYAGPTVSPGFVEEQHCRPPLLLLVEAVA